MIKMFVPKIYNGKADPQEVLEMGEQKLTWRDVLDCKKTYSCIGDMAWAACDHRYRYFVWGDSVYQCMDNVGEEYKDTGLHTKDL